VPTYSYRCASCGFEFDQHQSFTDDSLTTCPDCGEPQLRKVFNNIGVTFNGSGFYRTDNRTSSPSGESKPKSAAGESKPASAPAAATSGSQAT
jgi:putative FmdB family regulatory protein